MYKRLVKYEMEQLIRGVFTPVFGILFPIFMLVILSKSALSDVPAIEYDVVLVSVFTTLVQIVPLSVGFIGFTAIYAQELEQKIPFRLCMFGIKESQMLVGKVITLIFVFTIGYIAYTLVAIYGVNVPNITLWNLLIMYAFLTFEMIGFITLGYTIAVYFKKFGQAYTVVTVLYFIIMFASGMMGMRESSMPDIMQKIIRFFPFSYISFDLYKIFLNQSYNFMPLIQSMLFFIGLSIVLCALVIRFKGTKNEA